MPDAMLNCPICHDICVCSLIAAPKEDTVPMEVDDLDDRSFTLEELGITAEEVKSLMLMRRVAWDDNIDVSYVTKPCKPCKPWRPTTAWFTESRIMRKAKFDPVESPKRRAQLKNDFSMQGCQCWTYYDNEPIGYSIFSLLGCKSNQSEVCIWCSRFGYAVFGHSTLGYCPEKALGLLD